MKDQAEEPLLLDVSHDEHQELCELSSGEQNPCKKMRLLLKELKEEVLELKKMMTPTVNLSFNPQDPGYPPTVSYNNPVHVSRMYSTLKLYRHQFLIKPL